MGCGSLWEKGRKSVTMEMTTPYRPKGKTQYLSVARSSPLPQSLVVCCMSRNVGNGQYTCHIQHKLTGISSILSSMAVVEATHSSSAVVGGWNAAMSHSLGVRGGVSIEHHRARGLLVSNTWISYSG